MKFIHTLQVSVVLLAAPVDSWSQERVYPMLSDFNQALGAEVSYVLPSGITRGATPLGDIDSFHARAGWVGTIRANEDHTWLAGAEWRTSLFDAPAGTPIPDGLHSVALKLGHEWAFADRWEARFEVDPGVYSDFEDVSGDDLNAPFALRFTYSPSTNLTWVLGLAVDPRSDMPVIGGPGVRWRFAPDWTLNLIMPRPRLEYAASESLTLFAGGELRGGSWRVSEQFGTRVNEARLDNEVIDYREIRVGAGARWRLGGGWSVACDGGWVIDRRFTFDRENLLLNGDGAPYFQAGVFARF